MLLVQVLCLAIETQLCFRFVRKDEIQVVEVQISSRVLNPLETTFGLNVVFQWHRCRLLGGFGIVEYLRKSCLQKHDRICQQDLV